MSDTRNLRAYYYSFTPTGHDEVDAILESVAQAGNGYHNTEDWRSKREDGSSPLSNMQRAANESAAQIQIIIGERDKLKADKEALLEALEMAMEIGDQCSRGFLGKFQAKARAAIAKAKGE